MTRASVVVLTMGDRPMALADAIESARSQDGVEVELIVVGNGCRPLVDDPAARVIATDQNIGVAAGRNLGWRAATAPVVLFLDDDARYSSRRVVAAAAERFEGRSDLAVMSFRVVDDAGRAVSKHIPMLWKANSTRVAEVTTFLGGACAIRRSVIDDIGGFPSEFFYALEETDLAWRVLDQGGAIQYAGDLEVIHPSMPLSLREGAILNTARNRVLLARRRLPVPLAVVYLMVRGLMSLGTVRSVADLGALARGYRTGFRDPIEARDPMRWRTAWRMLRLGRPPIV
jgi:GT2 family glycosyltransferase